MFEEGPEICVVTTCCVQCPATCVVHCIDKVDWILVSQCVFGQSLCPHTQDLSLLVLPVALLREAFAGHKGLLLENVKTAMT